MLPEWSFSVPVSEGIPETDTEQLSGALPTRPVISLSVTLARKLAVYLHFHHLYWGETIFVIYVMFAPPTAVDSWDELHQ